MITQEVLSILNKASNPLHLTLQLADQSLNAKENFELLVQGLDRFGQTLDETAARRIRQIADSLHSSEVETAQRLLEALPKDGNPATRWMAAALLESFGRHIEAADTLGSISEETCAAIRAFRLFYQAENLARGNDWEQAWGALQEAVKETDSYRLLCAADKMLGRVKEHIKIPSRRQCKVALLGSMTLDFLVPALRVGCFVHGIDAEIYSGGYNQYRQEILDANSSLAAFAPNIVIIATDWSCLGLPDNTDDAAVASENAVSKLRKLWRECRDRWGAFVIQYNFEIPAIDAYGRLSSVLMGGRARLLRRINMDLREAECKETGVALLDIEQIASVYGKRNWTSPVLWHSAKQYPIPDAIPVLVRNQLALIRAILGLNRKCLVLDLDGILWGGVVAEDGLSGIRLGGSPEGESYVAFQRYVQSLNRRGVILAVCSKNNEADAKLPFQAHPEMVLSLEDITMFVANWRPKDENLHQIAKTINIGLDSLVFLDDSPMERAWVRRQLPEVETPTMPEDPALYARAIDEQMYFEALSFTEEDLLRIASYRGNVKRKSLETASANVEEFLADLQMKAQLRPFDELDLPRIVQLLNKTNQFNLTTRRWTEKDVRDVMSRPGCYTQSLRLSDRYGEHGLTGVMIAVTEKGSLRIDTWLMSCRILGRRVEEVMLASLMGYAKAHMCQCLIGEYIPTAKNSQVRDLFDRLGFDRIAEEPDGVRRYSWDARRRGLVTPGFIQIDDCTQA